MDEFEIMRQQLAAMKRQLDTQKTVNRELMRKVMKSKTSWMNRLVKAEFFIIPVASLLIFAICQSYGISQWFTITFLVCGIIDALLDIRTVRIPSDIFSTYSIINLKKFMARQKKERLIQTCISGAFCAIWIMLFFYSYITADVSPLSDESAKHTGIVGGFIGLTVATIVIAIVYKKMQRTNDEILNEIGKFENDA